MEKTNAQEKPAEKKDWAEMEDDNESDKDAEEEQVEVKKEKKMGGLNGLQHLKAMNIWLKLI